MMDVGWGELLLLAVVALLIFGPEKLPKAAADAGRMVRKLREMASSAQKDLAPDVDISGIKNDLKAVTDLHPKRIMSSTLADLNNDATPNPKGQTKDIPAEQTLPSSAPNTKRRLDPDAT